MYRQLLSQIMRPMTHALLQKIAIPPGIQVLHVNCGEGSLSFHLAGVVGKKGRVVGIDPNPKHIHTARQTALSKALKHTDFFPAAQFKPSNAERFGLVFCHLQPTCSYASPDFLDSLWDGLERGGVAMFELIDLSSFISIPGNFAFERYLDLYTSVICPHWQDTPLQVQLGNMITQAGFRNIHRQFVAPVFLQGAYKHLPSLNLESIREEVLRKKLTSPEEFQILLYELRAFETREDSMISLPGIYQTWGYRG